MSLSASYSAVNPLWSLLIVDSPRPFIAKLGTFLNFIGGGGGGRPISLSEEDSAKVSAFLFLDSRNKAWSAYYSGVTPLASFDTVDNPRPPIASFGIMLNAKGDFFGNGGGSPMSESLLSIGP
jgi:hypothetical protein